MSEFLYSGHFSDRRKSIIMGNGTPERMANELMGNTLSDITIRGTVNFQEDVDSLIHALEIIKHTLPELNSDSDA